MADKKIKDLIREMIFETAAHEHEYAEVMANLVFSRDTDYDAKVDDAVTSDQKYDGRIQKINRALAKKSEKIQAQKELKNALPAQEFKSGMAKLNKQKGILANLQQQTIAEKVQNGFAGLNPDVKKYAVLRYLANECIKNEDFPIKTDSNDAFIYADEYAFKSSQTANNFREIADYVDYIVGNRASKITEPSSIVEIIKNDARQLDISLDKLTADGIVNVYNNLLTRIAEENRNKQDEKKQIEQSQIGVEPIQDFGNGLVMYRLLPDTEYYNKHGEHRNLVYESNQMGICIGNKNQAYSQKILDGDKNQYYTLRSSQKNGQLIPHCTIEVNGNIIRQVKGKSNGVVNENYMQPVREFLKTYLNCAFPGEQNTDGKRQLYDYQNIGFVRDVHGKTVDLFNLPPDTELGKISYAVLKTRGVNVKNIKYIECVQCKNQVISDRDLQQLMHINVIKTCDFLYNAKLSGNFDFSNVEKLHFAYADLTEVSNIKFNPNAESINLEGTTGLKGDLDFSNLKSLDLSYTDLTNVSSIKFNLNAEKIVLRRVEGLKGNLDFSNVKDLILYDDIDLTNVTDIKFNPNAERIRLNSVQGLKGNLDFSNVNTLDLGYTSLTNVSSIKFNRNAESIDVYGKLKGELDFSNIKNLHLDGADLTKVSSIKFNPNAESVSLRYTKGLKGELDFSNVKTLYLDGVDLTKVSSIKLNPNMDISLSYISKSLKGELDFSNIRRLELRNADLTNVSRIKFNPNAERIYLENVRGLKGELDFSNVQSLQLAYGDLTKVSNIKFNPNAAGIRLANVKGLKKVLKGELDFSNVVDASLVGVDLTNVSNIKFNSNADIINLGDIKGLKKLLKGELDFSNVNRLQLGYINLTNVSGIKFNPNAASIMLHGVKGSKNVLKGKLDFSNVKDLDFMDVDLTNVSGIRFYPNGAVYGISPEQKQKLQAAYTSDELKSATAAVQPLKASQKADKFNAGKTGIVKKIKSKFAKVLKKHGAQNE